MIRSTENQQKKFYLISGGEWEAAVLAKDAVDAAAYGLEKAFEEYGSGLMLSNCITVTNASDVKSQEPEDIEGASRSVGYFSGGPSKLWSVQQYKNILPKIIQYCHDHNVEVSLDSRHHQNIKKALDLGIDIINDVSGFESEEMSVLAANSGKKIILMHNLGVPADKNKIIPQDKNTIE